MATTLLPFRDYDEHDVLNLFSFSGTLPLTKGHCVHISGSGFQNTSEMAYLGDVGNNFANTVSERYGVPAHVALSTNSDHVPLGITLYDVKETDENGEKLIFNPRKAAEMEVALSGQAVPVLTKGIVLYSGAQLGSAAAGTALYHHTDGELTTNTALGTKVGIALGGPDTNGHVLVRINL
tara:strand:+ start:729 stop:1268 length:540 start_codon:yes stop_codon:yes gene_type:complete